jgi:two-component system sensor histidine kinase/response regulator
MSQLTTLPTVLMISAHAEDEAKAAAAAAGASGFLVKPIDSATLHETLISLFDASQSLTTEPVAASIRIPMVAPHLRGSRILVAEDNEINRLIAVELLTDAGLVVDIAENGCVACARVLDSSEQYDAILMDIQMPEMDGLEATSRIRRRWSAERLPIIAMTAHAYEAERQRCLDVGMNDHIAKPVDPALLVATLDRWLNPRNASIVAAPVSEAASEPADGLPASLPPFDLDAGLRRMNGKRVLLRKLIVNFGDTFADAMPTLRGQITSGAVADARRLAHTLKGAAGALEIHAVFNAASQVEAALAADVLDGLEDRLDRLEQAMLPALAASALLKAASTPAQAVNTSPPDYTTVIPIILELRQALEHRSLRARAIFQSLERALGLSSATADLHAVQTALDRLNYGEALKILDELPGLDDMTRFGLADVELNR